MKETVKDYVPVDSESVTHNMWVLLMFRSVMVHTKGIIEFLGRTILLSKTAETLVFSQLFCYNRCHKGITNASLARLEVCSAKAVWSVLL